MNRVILSPEYFPNPTIGRPISGAQIFVGEVDTDPEVVINQKQISVQQEDGNIVQVSQPVLTGGGGIPLHNGSPVTILVDGDYALKVLDKNDSQIYYVPSQPYQEVINNVDDMLGLINIAGQSDGDTAEMIGFFISFPQPSFKGGSGFVWQEDQDKTTANGGTIIDPDNTGGFDGTISTRDAFLTAQGGGVGTGCWVRLSGYGINPKIFGAIADGVQDDTEPVQVFFDIFDTIEADETDIYDVTALTIEKTGAVFNFNGASITSPNETIIELLNSNDVDFNNLNLLSSNTSASVTFLGLVHSQDKELKNINFNFCSFSAPDTETNAVKLISQGLDGAQPNAIIENINFNNCKFKDIGRMGIEIQNHNVSGGEVDRYIGINARDCTFENLGLQSAFGMGTSYSGRGFGCSVSRNTFSECKDVVVENVGASGTLITDNIFMDHTTSANLISVTGTWRVHNLIISGNTSIEGLDNGAVTSGRVQFFNMEQSKISNNIFRLNTLGVLFDDVTDCDVNNNRITMTGKECLTLQNGTSGNRFRGNTLDSSISVFADPVITFDGATTVDNMIRDTTFGVGAGGVYAENTDSAIRNYCIGNTNLDNSPVFSFETVDMLDADYDMTVTEFGIVIPLMLQMTNTAAERKFETIPYATKYFIFNNTGNTIRLNNGANVGDGLGVGKFEIFFNGFNSFGI